jgi:hypothetical protein|tara:strand:+ start:48 stop:368 length:321 start_codon:yes stop_codon:yes gene_type:complete
MATGRLGNVDIPATTNTTAYTVPVGSYAVANVSLTNRNGTSVNIRVAMATTATPGDAEWIEYETVLIPNGVFERTGLVLQGGLNLVVYSTQANVGCTVYGIETSTT